VLFNSVEFIFFFLPITLLLYFVTAKKMGNEAAINTLVFCSLFFYSWWNPIYLLLLGFSMLFNYWLGTILSNKRNKSLLIFGITTNLALIAYYKYAGFFVHNINTLAGSDFNLGTIILPLAISFFTFQQIAYLVDSYQGITKEYKFSHYALFVSFFPQLIAGPIVHHKQMLPQFESVKAFTPLANNFAIGLSIFAIGLFKKTVLADGIAPYANPIFNAADAGQSLDFFQAWGGALAYTLQLYFDFSGYSDMAIGLARIFGIVLPLNFYSPYKAVNISEFWRRWHITLSTFLKDYIYIPLGGNRAGQFKRYNNLLITMLLGGLWHGAGWNFIIWGGLHGSYLIINHGWHALTIKKPILSKLMTKWLGWLITFFAVVVGWVFFRAVTLDGALSIISSMLGQNGFELPNAIYQRLGSYSEILSQVGVISGSAGGSDFVKTWLWIVLTFAIAILMPNTFDLFVKENAALTNKYSQFFNDFWPFKQTLSKIHWRSNKLWAYLCGVLLTIGLLTLGQVSEFLYFQF